MLHWSGWSFFLSKENNMATDQPGFSEDPYDLSKNPLQGYGAYGEGKISDGVNRLKSLQQALQSGQVDYQTYQRIFQSLDPQVQQLASSIAGGGSKAASAANAGGQLTQLGNMSAVGGTDLDTFVNQFRNLTGKAPTAQDINSYFSNVTPLLSKSPGGAQGTSYADVNSIINQYLSNSYQPQIQGYQQQQQQDQLNKAEQQAQGLVQQQNQANLNQFTSAPVQAQVKQAYNQNGMLDSGAYDQGIAQDVANIGQGNLSNVLGGVTIPGINNMQNTANQPYQSFLGNLNSGLQTAGQNQNAWSDFNLQKDLAEQLAGMNSPGSLQEWGPIIQGALQGGGLAIGGKKSAICFELMRRGLMTEKEFDVLHWKVLPALFTRCRALYVYAKNGDLLVKKANEAGFNWQRAKSWFVDEPLSEDSASAAVHRYSLACKKLAQTVAPELWDERVLKSNIFDFFRFIIPVSMVKGYRRCYKELFHRWMEVFCAI